MSWCLFIVLFIAFASVILDVIRDWRKVVTHEENFRRALDAYCEQEYERRRRQHEREAILMQAEINDLCLPRPRKIKQVNWRKEGF